VTALLRSYPATLTMWVAIIAFGVLRAVVMVT
jgi:hypothetical protein